MRTSLVERKTLETEITVKLNLDGTGRKKIDTGIRFYNHMLEQLASHGFFDIEITANSLDKDHHHVVEDVALTLGEAFKKALGNKKGINRYGWSVVPMDEALTMCSIDLSGRAYLGYSAEIKEEFSSDMETTLVKHFFGSFSYGSSSTLHVKLLDGEDVHHKIESMFKSFAKALNIACAVNSAHTDTVPSTKGVI